MYDVPDLIAELDRICSILEAMEPAEMKLWLALTYRVVSVAAHYQDITTTLDPSSGFLIPSSLLARADALGLRLSIKLDA
jgi:hypothetical protein